MVCNRNYSRNIISNCVYCKFKPIDQTKSKRERRKLTIKKQNRFRNHTRKDFLLSNDPNSIDDAGQISEKGQEKTNPEFNLYSRSNKQKLEEIKLLEYKITL
jgi:hypothetical protein